MDKKQMASLIDSIIAEVIKLDGSVDEKTVRGLVGAHIRRRRAEMVNDMKQALGLTESVAS